jgi:membrane-associated phospholipid phosphatase
MRILKLILPGEWAVVLFTVYSLCYIAIVRGPKAILSIEFSIFGRGIDVMFALSIVGTCLMLLKLPAARASKKIELWLRRGFIFASFPLVVMCWVTWNEPFWTLWLKASVIDRLIFVSASMLNTFGLASISIAIWAWLVHVLRTTPSMPLASVLIAGLKDLTVWLIMVSCYSWMGDVIGTPTRDFDSLFQSIDGVLFFGYEPLILAQRLIHPWLSEWLAFSYSFYAVAYPLCLGSIYATTGQSGLRQAVTALSVALLVTYVSYSLIPVKGPALSMHFEVPLELYFIQPVKEMLMDRSRITYDCFPSFHTAGTLLMSWLCWRNARSMFWVMLPMAVSTPIACVYLRYHYVTDVLAGAVLAALVIWFTKSIASSIRDQSATGA